MTPHVESQMCKVIDLENKIENCRNCFIGYGLGLLVFSHTTVRLSEEPSA